jgi:alanyl-tRNA synthetase
VIDKREEYEALSERVRTFEKHYEDLRRDQMYKNIDAIVKEADHQILVKRMENIDKKLLKQFVDQIGDRLPNGFILLANVTGEKVTFIAKSNNDIHAGNIAKKAAQITGGNGGGRKDFAQAGGKDISKVDEALRTIKEELS